MLKIKRKAFLSTKKNSTQTSEKPKNFGDFQVSGNYKNPKILFIVDPINTDKVSNPKWAINKPQKDFIGQFLKGSAIEWADCCFLTAAPPCDKLTLDRDKAIGEHLKAHREEFLAICKRLQPKFMVAMGKLGARQVYGRSVQITKARGIVNVEEDWGNIPILPCLGINHVMIYPENREIFKADMETAKRIVADKFKIIYKEKIKTDYKWATDLKFLVDMEPENLAVDIESLGLNFHEKKMKVLTVQFCWEPGKAVAVDLTRLRPKALRRVTNQIRKILENPKVKCFGHNLKFDFGAIREKLGITIANYFWDTMVMAHLVDENMLNFSLADLVRRYVPDMAGYCLAPGTEVLTADMRHVPVETLSVGDELLTFDEEVSPKTRRKMRTGIVTSVTPRRLPCYRIKTSLGRELIVSSSHKFLYKYPRGGHWIWKEACALQEGDRLMPFPWEKSRNDYSAGYMGGIFDGEGWVGGAGQAGMRIGFAQSHGAVLDQANSILECDGFGQWTSTSTDTRKPLDNCVMSTNAALRALQLYRPIRLIDKKPWEGKALPRAKDGDAYDFIVEKEYVGLHEVISVSTSTRTIIAEGICQHNCDEFDKDPEHIGKTRMDIPLRDHPEKVLQYGCGDVDASFRLMEVLRERMDADPYFNNYYNRVLRPGLRAFCDIERFGFSVEKAALKEFEQYLRQEQKKLHAEILRMVPKTIRAEYAQFEKYKDKNGKVKEREIKFNLTRQAFLVGMCFLHPHGLKLKARVFTPSTVNNPDKSKRIPSISTKDHFPYFEGNPFVDKIVQYIKNEKLLTTYVGTEDNEDGELTGFYKYIQDGKIRPTYWFSRTDTGRTSSSEPNGQNFPKRGEGAKRFRRVFVAPPGWALVSADLSQAELRVAAFLANEETMLRYYKDNVDLHAATAAKVMGKSLKAFMALDGDTKGLARFRAKAVNFGFLYGMWWRKFMGYAKTQYGIDYTEEEAEAIRKAFFELYPGLEDWHKEYGDMILRDGFIRSPLGRIRHLPSVYSIDEGVVKAAVRQGINAPVQSFASDLGIMAIGRLHQAGIPEDKFRIIGFVHDDIICMAKEEYVGVAARTLKKFMETNPLKKWFGIDMPVDIVAEAAIGYNLAEMVEANKYISDKNLKTVDDLRNRLQAKLDSIPDTKANERDRKDIKKEISYLDRPATVPAKPASARRSIRLKSKSKSELRNANSTKRVKIKIRRRPENRKAA